jgi:hypothetical protein
MGHIRLGKGLPQTRSWIQVVDRIESNAEVGAVAAATLSAARKGLAQASDDVALVRSFWLLTQLPRCARAEDYPEALRQIGLSVAAAPSLVELVGAFSDAVDAHVRREGGRTDLGEMAQMGAAESLAADLGRKTQSLFGTTPDDVRRSLARLATSKQFSGLARDFFARLTERYLAYFLSRELSKHIGKDRRFPDLTARNTFNEALALHCREASRIVEEFAGGWFSKTTFETGITRENAAGFIHVALTKIQDEVAKGAVHGQ